MGDLDLLAENLFEKWLKKIYKDVSDFIQYPSQIILYNKESVFDWINQKSNINILYNSIDSNFKFSNYNDPYYIKFNSIVYLAQNSNTINKSLDISITWNTNNYNKNIFTKPNKNFKNISYNLHIYINNKIILNKIKGGDPSINILTYRNSNDDIIYISLLSL